MSEVEIDQTEAALGGEKSDEPVLRKQNRQLQAHHFLKRGSGTVAGDYSGYGEKMNELAVLGTEGEGKDAEAKSDKKRNRTCKIQLLKHTL